MYIRQECLFSFEEILKFQKESRLQMILSQLDFGNLINKLNKPSHKRGPKGHNPVSLINALIAMQVEKINDFKRLKERLDSDLSLKYNCGFDILKPAPSTSTFSRFLSKISSMPELEVEFKRLILKAKDLGIIDGTNVAIDSTKLDSFKKAKPKSKISDDGVSPNWGKKKDTDGNDIKWFGWKAHIIVDCKSELPLYIDITPASFNKLRIYSFRKGIDLLLPNYKIVAERYCPFIESNSIVVGVDGNVYPCYRFSHKTNEYIFGRNKKIYKYSFGSLDNYSLEEIYNSEQYKKFRNVVYTNRYPSCFDCSYEEGCDIALTNEFDCYTLSPSCSDCLWSRNISLCP